MLKIILPILQLSVTSIVLSLVLLSCSRGSAIRPVEIPQTPVFQPVEDVDIPDETGFVPPTVPAPSPAAPSPTPTVLPTATPIPTPSPTPPSAPTGQIINVVFSWWISHRAWIDMTATSLTLSYEGWCDPGDFKIITFKDDGTSEVAFSATDPFGPAHACVESAPKESKQYLGNFGQYLIGSAAYKSIAARPMTLTTGGVVADLTAIPWAPTVSILSGANRNTVSITSSAPTLNVFMQNGDAAGYYQISLCRAGYTCPH